MRLKHVAWVLGGVLVGAWGLGGGWQTSDAAYPVPPVPTTRGAVITPHAQFVTGRELYVSPTGNDTTGNGTQTAPYKTLEKAMAASKSGDLLRLLPGTYVLDKTLMWAPKRSIVGAGTSKTVIKPAETFKAFYNTLIWATRNPGQDPVPFEGRQFIRHLTLSGGGKKVGTGIHMWGRNHVLFDRLTFKDFGSTALDVGGPVAKVVDAPNDMNNPSLARGIEIANSTFSNCANETGDKRQYWSGAITFRQTDGILIHDNIIREPLGGGIKNTTSRTFRARIYNNHIRMTGTAERPYNNSASMEIWDLRNDNRVYKNNVNAWFSFVNQWVPEDKIPPGDNLLIYENALVATPKVTNFAHAMEIALKGAKIYRNRIGGFEYSAFWMEGWESPRTADIDIYRNYVYNEGTRRGWGVNLGPGNGDRYVYNVRVFNNTFDNLSETLRILATGPVERFERVTLVNNLILNGYQVYRFGGNSSNYPGLTVAKNVRFNTPHLGSGGQAVAALVSGTEQVTTPEMNFIGTRSLPYYAFKRVPNHPLVDKGVVIPGLTFSRRAPDIGAYELP